MKIMKYLKQPKKIIINLAYKGFFNWMNDRSYLKMLYKLKMNTSLNLENPKTFNEKLQWLKIYDRKEIYTTMVDKYKVKDYIANMIGEEYIIPTLGVYDKFSNIDFSKLPNQFVIKCTHDSGGLVICRDKKQFNQNEAQKKLNQSMKKNFFHNNREWPYKNVEPKIIIEKYMQNEQDTSLSDYKFYCFNGNVKYLYISMGLENHQTARIAFFDTDFKPAGFGRSDYQTFDSIPNKPKNYERMKELAEKLSQNNPFMRVDFYEINGKIYFSELTLYPCGGFMPFQPKEWDYKLGKLLTLPKKEDIKNEK